MVTPPRNSDLASAPPEAAKWPIWLNTKLETDARSLEPMPAVWAASGIFSSIAFAHTGS